MYRPAYLVCKKKKKKLFGRLTEVVPPPAHREPTAFEGFSKLSSDVQSTYFETRVLKESIRQNSLCLRGKY